MPREAPKPTSEPLALARDIWDFLVEVVDDEWGKPRRPYTGDFEPMNDMLDRLESLSREEAAND